MITHNRAYTVACALVRRCVSVAVLTLCLCAVAVSSCTSEDEPGWEEVSESAFLDSVMRVAGHDPDEALQLLASGEQSGLYSQDSICACKVKIYLSTYDYANCESALRWLVENSDVSGDSYHHMECLSSLVDVLQRQQKMDDAFEIARLADSIDASCGYKTEPKARFRYKMGEALVMSSYEEAMRYLDESIELCVTDKDTLLRLVCVRSLASMQYASVHSDYDRSIKVGRRVLSLVGDNMAGASLASEEKSSLLFSINAMMCLAYADKGMMSDAYRSYDNAVACVSDSASSQKLLYMTNCLLSMKRYHEAEDLFIKIGEGYSQKGDTVSYEYAKVLDGLLVCAEGYGDLNRAYDISQRIIKLRKAIYLDCNKSQYTEWESVYRTKAKEDKLEANHKVSRRMSVISFSVAVLMFVMLFVLFFVVMYYVRVNKMNRLLAIRINEFIESGSFAAGSDRVRVGLGAMATDADAKRDETGEKDAAGDAAADDVVTERMRADVDLFLETVKEKRLYADSNFDRDGLLDDLGISKRGFSQAFKSVTGVSCRAYMSDMRLEYVADCIRRHPDVSAEKLAIDCGYESRATFYRQFSKRFGMSPLEYRKKCLREGQTGE